MYRIDNRSEAIKRVQQYLLVVGNPDIFVATTGAYDENTRLSVLDYQGVNNLEQSGVVDRITFDRMFGDFIKITEREKIKNALDPFIVFPILPGSFSDEMIHINRTLGRLLTHYGYSHSIRDSNFYSKSTSEAVKIMRLIYLLDEKDSIDEELYSRMMRDLDSIGNNRRIL